MKEYKNTLNLPKTEFPMKGNLPSNEPLIQKKWEEMKLYEKLLKERDGNKKFILHDGPPYANGNIHIGHSVNKILKDIILRSKSLSGYYVPFTPGWDCHGLPIELEVEKKIKKDQKVTDKEFRSLCRQYANEQVINQKNDFMRLGVIGDWENPYLTLDKEFESSILDALKKVYKNGHLQKGFKPVHWCVKCQSALAEAEVEYEEKESTSVDVKFRLLDSNVLLNSLGIKDNIEEISVVIWTTTPWTLPSNQAVAINNSINYALLSCNNEYYIIADDLVNNFQERTKLKTKKIKVFDGSILLKHKLKHPFLDITVPILHGEHVTVETGTGCVHTAPAHGIEDFNLGVAFNLSIVNPIQSNGIFNGEPPELNNIHIYKLDEPIIEILKSNSNLLHKNKFRHSYPHCWRHKNPVIFRATPQWFISMNQKKLIQNALEKSKNVKWIPDWGLSRIRSMLDDRPDWCISRQRRWGVPITLLVNVDTGELHPNTIEIFETVIDKVRKEGIDAWYEVDIKDLIKEKNYEKVNDTLDVWFDSGATHEAVLKKSKNLEFPADLYLEGSDQHRGWFQSSLLTSIAISGELPYKSAMTHGFTVDAKGNKMSKSKGNVISPQKIVNRLGADILRLWVASTDYSSEITVSEEILNRTSDKYRKIRNTIRFLLANTNDYKKNDNDVISVELDKWIMKRSIDLHEKIMKEYKEYNFHILIQMIHVFCTNDLGSLYLDIIKDRQYTMKDNSSARISAQATMNHILNMLLLWLAPICPHTTEEAWSYMKNNKEESIFLQTWYDYKKIKIEKPSIDENDWQNIFEVKKLVTKVLEQKRESEIIGSSLDASILISCQKKIYESLSKLGTELKFMFITSNAVIKECDDFSNMTIENIKDEKLSVKVNKDSNPKCARCWHKCESIGESKEHKEICKRCIENIEGNGEKRVFA